MTSDPNKTEPAERRPEFEPYELNRPIPILVLSVALALASWGAITMIFNSSAPGPGAETAPVGSSAEEVAAEAPAEPAGPEGAAVFAANCATCHQTNGMGMRGAVPPLAGSRYVLAGDGTPMAAILLRGVAGPISVAGRYYDGQMPDFSATLDDAKIAAVVSYARSSWGNNAAALTAEKVAPVRAEIPADAGPWDGGAGLEAGLGIDSELSSATRITQEASR